MRSLRTIHNYFIVAVMRAPALPLHPALAGRPLLKPGPRGKMWTCAAGWTLLHCSSGNICCMMIQWKSMTDDMIICSCSQMYAKKPSSPELGKVPFKNHNRTLWMWIVVESYLFITSVELFLQHMAATCWLRYEKDCHVQILIRDWAAQIVTSYN